MAKSLRSKRKQRLKAVRRELVEPIYDKKEAAKVAASEAALAAPKLPVKHTPSTADASSSLAIDTAMDVEMAMAMADGHGSIKSLKPLGKKLKKRIKISKRQHHGKGKIRRKSNV